MRLVISTFCTASCIFCSSPTRADDLLYRYDGDVLPYDPSAGWLDGLCEDTCYEALEDGYFLLRWPEVGDRANYHYWITQPPDTPPPSLWVEWRVRSNHPIPPHSYQCDAGFTVRYINITDWVNIHGDAVISSSGNHFVWGLPNNEFRTYRFESPDGINFWFSVDGLIFKRSYDTTGNNGANYLQLAGRGGCLDDWIPNMENAWDFVRFGTISYGEQIAASDPPAGFIDARQHPTLDRFTVHYDSPNYVYLDEIAVEVTSLIPPLARGEADPALTLGVPIVVATRRLDNGPADVVEIVLDQPIPYNATTRFTFDNGELSQVLEFTYAPGDIDGDGQATLSDLAAFQNCFGLDPLTGVCPFLDFDVDEDVDLLDFAEFQNLVLTPSR